MPAGSLRDFLKRTVVLTPQEQKLAAGILIIFLIGLAARYRYLKQEENAPLPAAEAQRLDEALTP